MTDPVFPATLASQFASDDLDRVTDEGFAIFNVPGGASGQEVLRCLKKTNYR
jgi:hypothetical protein